VAIATVSTLTLEPASAPTVEPTPTNELYDRPNFEGTHEVHTEGKYPDLSKTKIGIDRLRSIKVLPGTRAVNLVK